MASNPIQTTMEWDFKKYQTMQHFGRLVCLALDSFLTPSNQHSLARAQALRTDVAVEPAATARSVRSTTCL